jgi:hypothetical protein
VSGEGNGIEEVEGGQARRMEGKREQGDEAERRGKDRGGKEVTVVS